MYLIIAKITKVTLSLVMAGMLALVCFSNLRLIVPSIPSKIANAANNTTSNLIIGTENNGSVVELSVCLQNIGSPIHITDVSLWFKFNGSALSTEPTNPTAAANAISGGLIEKGLYGNGTNGYGRLKWEQVLPAPVTPDLDNQFSLRLDYAGNGSPGFSGIEMSSTPELYGKVRFDKNLNSTYSKNITLTKNTFFSTETIIGETNEPINQNIINTNSDCRNFKSSSSSSSSSNISSSLNSNSSSSSTAGNTTSSSLSSRPSSSSVISSVVSSSSSRPSSSSSSSSSSSVVSSSSSSSSSSVSSSSSSTPAVATSSSSSRPSSSSSSSSSSAPSTNQTNLDLKVNLSGGYSDTTDTNSTTLRSGNKIPLSQPYNVSPWSYTGSESVSAASDIPASATDWVLVEVKDASGASVLKKAGFLLSNGNVVDATVGSSSLSLGNLATGSYKVVVRHRNHIAIATDVNVSLTSGSSTTVDLTKNVNVKASNQVKVGTDSTGGDIFGMRNSNVNGDGVINAVDKGTARLAGATTLYSNNDVNLDGVVNATDKGTVRLAGAAAENL